MILAAGEADAEVRQEVADVREQAAFEVALVRFRAEAEEVEVVGFIEELMREIGLCWQEGAVKLVMACPCRT